MPISLWLMVLAILRHAFAASRIIGGSRASIDNFPYQLSLQLKEKHRCGASLLSETVAITAAHCLQVAGTYTVRAGSTRWDSGGVQVLIRRALIHPRYSSASNDYDIALLFFAKALQYSDKVKPIKLPKAGDDVKEGMIGKVSGWGSVFSAITVIPEELRVVEVPVCKVEKCRRAYLYGMFTDNMFCAGLPSGGKDSCQGDSGGPFVANGLLYGIISFGLDCAQPGYPGVYTSIPRFRTFIAEYANL